MSEVNASHNNKTVVSRGHSQSARTDSPSADPRPHHASTGPITAAGKHNSSQNATTHGCTTTVRIHKGRLTPESEARLVLPDESRAEWDELKLNWETAYQTNSELHLTLVTQAAVADWLMRRSARRHDEAEQELYMQESSAIKWTSEQHALLDRFLRYQVRAERAFYRARHAVEQLRREQKRDSELAPPPPPAVALPKAVNAPPTPAHSVTVLPNPYRPSSSLIQTITVQTIDGKTFSIFQPRSENFARIIQGSPEPKPTVQRAVYFLHGIPDEYAWVTDYDTHDDRHHFVITRTAAEALADLAHEAEQGALHVLNVS